VVAFVIATVVASVVVTILALWSDRPHQRNQG